MNVLLTLPFLFAGLEDEASLTREEQIRSVGGQAVLEGVLMRGSTAWGLAVRNPEGGITRESWPARNIKLGGLEKVPVIRGACTMIEMLREGTRALSRSGEIALGEEEELKWYDRVLTGLLALVLIVGLFVWLPHALGRWSGSWWNLGPWGQNWIEGGVRGLVFVAYIGLLGLWPDMARVLAYHGAEHKTINAWEAGAEMSPERVAAFSRIHPRCGTSFLLVVVVVSILVFSAIGTGSVLWRVGMRVLLMPLVVGLSYEIIRFSAKNALGCRLMKPALLLQYLTTREPDSSQVDCGIAALNEALEASARLGEKKG